MSQIVVAYGFEYNAFINTNEYVLCKCIESKHPFYTVPSLIIYDTDMTKINYEIEKIKNAYKQEIYQINIIARDRCFNGATPPCWKIVIYGENLKFNPIDINYESEGDENGDGR